MTATVKIRGNPAPSEGPSSGQDPVERSAERPGPVGWAKVSYDGASFLVGTYQASGSGPPRESKPKPVGVMEEGRPRKGVVMPSGIGKQAGRDVR